MRATNIELCRIISILLVLIVHSNYAFIGWPNSLNETSLIRLFIQSFSIIGVNVFVLITGYFSTTPKKKSIVNLVTTVLYYGIILLILGYFIGRNGISYKSILFLSSSNWFVLDYIGLLLFCPFLNSYVETATQSQFLKSVIMLIIFQMYFGWLPGFNLDFNHGYSILSFMIIYLIGRYLRLYGLPFLKYPLLIYLICTIILTLMGYFSLKYNIGVNSIKGSVWLDTKVYCYNNPIVIISSIAFFWFFVNTKIQDSKFINHISKSCLAVLLIHTSWVIVPYLKRFFIYNLHIESQSIQFISYLIGILIIFITCVLVDQIRLFSFNKLLKLNK